jgi:hypothetical protein
MSPGSRHNTEAPFLAGTLAQPVFTLASVWMARKRRIRTADAISTLGFQYVCVPPIRVLGFGYQLTNPGVEPLLERTPSDVRQVDLFSAMRD